MTRLDSLTALRDAVKAETLSTAMCEAFFQPRHEHWDEDPAYHMMAAQMGSLDAALALHEAVLPGWSFYVWNFPPDNKFHSDVSFADGPEAGGSSDTPSRAWLLAILSALIAKEGKE
jgi:hypothetical protein